MDQTRILDTALLDRMGTLHTILPGGGIKVHGSMDLQGCHSLGSLGDLECVEGYLDLQDLPVRSLGRLSHVQGFLNLNGTRITSTGNLIHVGGSLYIEGTRLDNVTELAEAYRAFRNTLAPEDIPMKLLDKSTANWQRQIMLEALP